MKKVDLRSVVLRNSILVARIEELEKELEKVKNERKEDTLDPHFKPGCV